MQIPLSRHATLNRLTLSRYINPLSLNQTSPYQGPFVPGSLWFLPLWLFLRQELRKCSKFLRPEVSVRIGELWGVWGLSHLGSRDVYGLGFRDFWSCRELPNPKT